MIKSDTLFSLHTVPCLYRALKNVHALSPHDLSTLCTLNEGMLKLEVSRGMRIRTLQRQIERSWGISARNQRLLYKERELCGKKRFQYYAISEGDTIYLTKQLGLYSVFLRIKLHSEDESSSSAVSKPITIGFEKSDTIYNVKLQAQLFLQIPALQQRYVQYVH